jgi:hypothetical protein
MIDRVGEQIRILAIGHAQHVEIALRRQFVNISEFRQRGRMRHFLLCLLAAEIGNSENLSARALFCHLQQHVGGDLVCGIFIAAEEGYFEHVEDGMATFMQKDVSSMTIAGGDGLRLPTANELQGACYQGRKIAETANKLHG